MARNRLFSKNKNIPYNYIWTKNNPMSFITESFQKFLANLEYINVDKKYKVLQVTSSISGEGKSTFFSNVAYLLGQKKLKILLIDLDFRKPKVHKIFNIENNNGMTDLLADRVSLEDAIHHDKSMGFDVITSGEKTSAVTNLLESKKLKKMLEELKEHYDYILLDSPPLINVSDSLYISKLSDAVVFVISLDKTKRMLVREANKLIKQNNIKCIGAVLTQVDLKNKRYGYSYGYGYSYNYYQEDDN